MAPKKQTPAGPRPRRLTRATAKLISSDLKSPEKIHTETTLQSPSSVAVLQPPPPPPDTASLPIITEAIIVARTAAESSAKDESERNCCAIASRESEGINFTGDETPENVNCENREITRGIEAQTKKKTKKKVVVKVVKKLVKKRVPKSSVKDFALATSSSCLAKEEAFDDDKGLEKQIEILDCDNNGSFCSPTGSRKCEIDMPILAEGIDGFDQPVDISMEVDKLKMVDGGKDVSLCEVPVGVNDKDVAVENFDPFATELPIQDFHSAPEMAPMDKASEPAVREFNYGTEFPTEMANVELAGDRNNDGEGPFSDFATEMRMEVANMELFAGGNNEGKGPNSDFGNGMRMEMANVELVGNSEVADLTSESTSEMLMEVRYMGLVAHSSNGCESSSSGTAIEKLTEMDKFVLVDGRNNEVEGVNSDSAPEVPTDVVNQYLIRDRINEGAAQTVESSSGYEEGGKEDSEISNGRIILSGELEALKRKRRRRTEIFIGGLNKDAKEADIRKAFEEVGEIVEVRLVINSKTHKNKGFAFVRYASAADAKRALDKYPKIEICGKQCSTAPVEGNDTIFLGNIDKKWTDKDVIKLLQERGIEKIDKVTVIANPFNVGCNRGFAFLELETHKDAQIAFKKLQNKEGKLKSVKVAWAEPLNEPDEEELLKVKSVYAECLPPSWDEEKVRSYFMKFGEIENIVLSRNLHSSKRKDFAFINFRTREAALACIESFNHKRLPDEGSQVNVKVSLAKPMPKGKSDRNVSKTTKETSKKKHAAKNSVQLSGHREKEISMNSQRTNDLRSPGTSRLEQLLAERAALRKQMQARPDTGIANLDYAQALPGQKRSFSALEDDLRYSDPRRQTRIHLENSSLVGSPSYGVANLGAEAVPHPYHRRQGADYGLGHRFTDYASNFQDYANSFQRENAPYRGVGSNYYRY